MKECPFCAEEIQDAAIRCKHCRSDLTPGDRATPGAPDRRRTARGLLSALIALALLALGAPVIARSIVHQYLAARCRPSTWVEWHAAMRRQCLQPEYVCEHMTTAELLGDPDVARSFRPGTLPFLAELVGRMRDQYGCAPERGPAPHRDLDSTMPPALPPSQDAPRSL